MIGRQDTILQHLYQMMEDERYRSSPPLQNMPLRPSPPSMPEPPMAGPGPAPFEPEEEEIEEDGNIKPEFGPVNQTQRELDEIFPSQPKFERNPTIPGQRPGVGKSVDPKYDPRLRDREEQEDMIEHYDLTNPEAISRPSRPLSPLEMTGDKAADTAKIQRTYENNMDLEELRLMEDEYEAFYGEPPNIDYRSID